MGAISTPRLDPLHFEAESRPFEIVEREIPEQNIALLDSVK